MEGEGGGSVRVYLMSIALGMIYAVLLFSRLDTEARFSSRRVSGQPYSHVLEVNIIWVYCMYTICM